MKRIMLARFHHTQTVRLSILVLMWAVVSALPATA